MFVPNRFIPTAIASMLVLGGCGDSNTHHNDLRDDIVATHQLGMVTVRGLSLKLLGDGVETLPSSDVALSFTECTNANGKSSKGRDVTVLGKFDLGVDTVEGVLTAISDEGKPTVLAKTVLDTYGHQGEAVTCNVAELIPPQVVTIEATNTCGDAAVIPKLMNQCDENTDGTGNNTNIKELRATPGEIKEGYLAAYIGYLSKKSIELFSDNPGIKDKKETVIYRFDTVVPSDE